MVKKEEPKVEKIVLTLGEQTQETKVVEPIAMQQQAIPFEDKNPFEPQLIEHIEAESTAFNLMGYNYNVNDFDANREEILDARETEIFELELGNNEPIETPFFGEIQNEEVVVNEVVEEQKLEVPTTIITQLAENVIKITSTEMPINTSTSANLLSKPSNIYSSYNAEVEKVINEAFGTTAPENVFELSIKETPVEPIFEIENMEEEELVFEVSKDRKSVV